MTSTLETSTRESLESRVSPKIQNFQGRTLMSTQPISTTASRLISVKGFYTFRQFRLALSPPCIKNRHLSTFSSKNHSQRNITNVTPAVINVNTINKFSQFGIKPTQPSIRQYSSNTPSPYGGPGDDKDEKDVKPSENNNPPDTNYNPKDDSFFTQDVAHGKKQNKGQGEPERPYFQPLDPKDEDVTNVTDVNVKEKVVEEEELTAPTNCCRSGCPNCVWIEYVEKLTSKLTNPELGRERILKDLDTIDDPSIRSFIMMELRSKGLI